MAQHPQTSQVLVALGSNMGDRHAYLREGSRRIADQCGPIIASAPIFTTQPEGGVADQTFLNSALICETTLTPIEFLSQLHSIEAACDRTRERRWDNRTLDLDIILWRSNDTSLTLNTKSLMIPHPHFRSRMFVLAPAVAIAGDWHDPVTGKTVQQLYESCDFRHDA